MLFAKIGKAASLAMLATVLAGPSAWWVAPARGDDTPKEEPAKAAKEEAKEDAAKPKVAVFRLAGGVTEAPADETFSFGGPASVSLKDLVARIKKAGEDPDVKALVILHEGGTVGRAQVEELRQAMAKVRALGKEVHANADSLSMSEYVLLSGASRLSVVPTADLWITGLYGEAPYLRGLLDKIGVKPDFLTCGDYKSAAEMFMRRGPSPEAQEMQDWLLDGIFAAMVERIAQGRGVEPAKVREWIDAGPYTAEKAKAAGLIDAVEHRQEFEAMLKSKFGEDVVFDKKYGQKKATQLDVSSPFALFKFWADLLAGRRRRRATRTRSASSTSRGRSPSGGPSRRPSTARRRGARRSARRSTRRPATPPSRRSSCGSIRPAARPSPARSSSTPPGG